MMKDASFASQQKGFTLIEVLVTVVILAVGLLGLSAMQLTSLKVNQGAYTRSQAALMAADMLDRMRANPVGVEAGYYNALDTEDTIPIDQSCSSGCDAEGIASQDFREWAANFSDIYDLGGDFLPLVPGGQGTVTRDSSTNIVTVTVEWQQETWTDQGGKRMKSLEPVQFELEAQL